MAGQSRKLVLVAMIFAVAMIFIDQTIVALAIPRLQRELHLSPTGAQWIVNGYLLSLSALFALGGRVADVVGHRRVVLIGVSAFAVFSALCGLTPTSSIGETWIILFRVLQGASAAFLFPAALAIVVASFPVQERGRALAIFFSASGGLTAIGPLAGGYLTQWTWRSIFWINVPVAIVAVVLTLRTEADGRREQAQIDWPGAALVSAGMGLAVLGLQQASTWGWHSVATWGCLAVGLVLLGVFVRQQLANRDEPLVPMRLFANRAFAVDNGVLFLLSICFVPFFFFASVYAQAALGESSQSAGLFLLVFFGGFTLGAQWGGRVLDARGARPTVVLGCAVAAVGFYLWGSHMDQLSFGKQWYWLALTGVGMGMVLGPVSTDALNQAASTAYGAVTGVTQTVRNFGGSLGLAVLGSILITENVSRAKKTLGALGVPAAKAEHIAHAVSAGSGEGAPAGHIPHSVALDFAYSTRTVVYGMAGAMALAFLLAARGMPRQRARERGAEQDEGARAPALSSG
jgi:EmrB/QacA subfamily drug resistance transporter